MINFTAKKKKKNAFHPGLELTSFPLDLERLVLITACQYDLGVLGGEQSLITSGVEAAKQDRRLLICHVKLCFKTLSLSHPLCTSALPRSLWRTNERGQLTKRNPTMQSF